MEWEDFSVYQLKHVNINFKLIKNMIEVMFVKIMIILILSFALITTCRYYLCFLQDDSPRSSTISFEPAPVTVHIDHLVVERNDDGSFHIRGIYEKQF